MDNMSDKVNEQVLRVINRKNSYALILGNAKEALASFPAECIDCVITSPPYWKQREYIADENLSSSMIGVEDEPSEYVFNLVEVFSEIMRVLKKGGSVWLNIGDKYLNKNLMGMPWRVALRLQEEGWIIRNDVIWEKMKGSDPAKDRLRTNHEHIFHLVKTARDYYFDHESILIKPTYFPEVNGERVKSATGVTGSKYRKQIIQSADLSDHEKRNAIKSLDSVIAEMESGEVVDFRMTIRGYQRTYHSNKSAVSGRAKELAQKGYFILKSHSRGYMPSDVWQIAPEDNVINRSEIHYAVFPPELLRIPILATCPPGGILLDPFAGSGSALVAGLELGRRGIGVDISSQYLEIAESRLRSFQATLGF